MTLWNLARNHEGRIRSVGEAIDSNYRQRLVELGIDQGALVRCLRRSWLGGPRVYQVGSVLIAMERVVAENISISEVGK